MHLIRHGQVVGHDQPRYNGQTDVALTKLGISQYQRLAERLADWRISACYTASPRRSDRAMLYWPEPERSV